MSAELYFQADNVYIPGMRFRNIDRDSGARSIDALRDVERDRKSCRSIKRDRRSSTVQRGCSVRMSGGFSVRGKKCGVQYVNVFVSDVRWKVEILLSLVDAEESFRCYGC